MCTVYVAQETTWDPPIDEMVAILEEIQRKEMEEIIANAKAE